MSDSNKVKIFLSFTIADNYIDKITSEITAGKSGQNPTTIVESTDTWTTTYIRYEYPTDEINDMLKLNSDFKWNHDKQLIIRRTYESDIPNDTKLVLIDPNSNSDKAYYSTAGAFNSNGDQRVINLSQFADRSGNNFNEKTLYSLLDGKIQAETVADGEKGYYNEVSAETEGAIPFTIGGTKHYYQYDGTNGTINLTVSKPIYEDYYLSMSVTGNQGDSQNSAAYVVQFEPVNALDVVDDSGNPVTTNIIRASVKSKLNSMLIIGDFFGHTIESFDVTTTGGNVISEANKQMIVTTTSKIYFKNERGQADYFKNNIAVDSVSLYHSFNISLLRYENGVSDIIRGLSDSDIKATYTINDSTETSAKVIRESNYIQLMAADDKTFKSALTATTAENDYTITVTGIAEMNFSDYKAEFPSNTEELDNIGVKTSVRSNIAYNENDLPYSGMYASQEDSIFYYTKEQNNASLTFEAVEELDEEEIGAKTDNKSRLGINSKYSPNQKTINAKAVYTATDVTDYSYATDIRYTIQLLKKTKGDDSITKYVQVDNISEYITSVTLTDTGGDGNLVKTSSTDNEYVYTFKIDHNSSADNDQTFYTDFSCKVLSGSDFTKKDFANYRIQITVELIGASNNLQRDYIVYTNAKINPEVIPPAS